MKNLTVKHRINTHPQVVAALAVATAAQAKYHTTLAESESLLSREERIEAYRRLIESTSDIRELEAATEKLASLESPIAELARQRASQLCVAELLTFKDSLPALLDAGDAAIDELRTEAVEAETAMFRIFGLPWEKTSVSRRIDEAGSNIRGFRDALNPAPPQQLRPVPGAFGNILTYFR